MTSPASSVALSPTKLSDRHPALLVALRDAGFRVRDDLGFHFCAVKEYATAVGPREACVSIYASTPDRVDALYQSEGRNILDIYSWDFARNPAAAIRKCEEAIAQSYAVRVMMAAA